MKRAIWLAASSVVLMGAVAGQRIESGTAAAEQWLALVDDGKYEESWDAGAALFRDGIQKPDWVASVGAVRDPLGKVKSRKQASANQVTQLPGAPDGLYVVIEYHTAFAKKRSAVETVTLMADMDGRWRVFGYQVN